MSQARKGQIQGAKIRTLHLHFPDKKKSGF